MSVPFDLGVGFMTAESLDSSKLRSSTVTRAQEVGLVRVTRYGRTAGYVASPEVLGQLAEAAERLSAVSSELHAARPLLVAALRLGIDPSRALDALLGAGGPGLDVAALAELVAEATDDLDAARVARERLAQPADRDVDLDDVAAELGLDIDAMRADVRAGHVEATVTAS
jgi:hypothetical protein